MGSLSKNEKRYIHLNLKTYVNEKEHNYFLEDFENLDNHTGKKLNSENHPSLKSNVTRLQQRILDILFQFHEDELPNSDESTRKLKRAKVLIHKGFYAEGVKLLDKIVHEEDDYDYLTKIEALELKLDSAIKFVDMDYLKNNLAAHKLVLNKLNQEYSTLIEFRTLEALIKLETTIYNFYDEKNELTPEYRELLRSEQKAFHPLAKIFFNKANAFLKVKAGTPDEALVFAIRTIELFEDYPGLKKKNILTYLKSVRNLCIIYIHLKRFSKAIQLLEATQEGTEHLFKHATADVRTELFTLMVLLRMEVIISEDKVHQNLDKLLTFTKAYQESSELLRNDEKASACLNLAIFNLEAGKFKSSLRHVIDMISYSKEVRKDLQHLGYMAEITLHYFLGNSDVLKSKISSYQRFLQKEGVLFSYEKDVIGLLKAIFDHPHISRNYKILHEAIRSSLEKEGKLMYLHYTFFMKLKPLY